MSGARERLRVCAAIGMGGKMFEQLGRSLERWGRGERLEGRELEELEKELEAWLEAELGAVTRAADGGDGEGALGRLTRATTFASAAAAQRPALADAILGKAGGFRSALESVAKALGAVDFSITLGVPVALSFTLTFVVARPGARTTMPPDTD